MPFKPHPDNPDLVIYTPNEYWIPKPWVGLTIDESSELYNKNYDLYATDMPIGDFLMIQREVEAKLKEKNT